MSRQRSTFYDDFMAGHNRLLLAIHALADHYRVPDTVGGRVGKQVAVNCRVI